MTTISLDHITKIEGHAKLVLSVERGEVQRCELSSLEGSRYFEGMVRRHRPEEAFEITSRICGICSSAHVLAAVQAAEHALGISPSDQTVLLRALLNTGERIRSHAAHLYFLALPDYLGFDSALEMVPTHRKEVERALRLLKLGNDMVTEIGGRVMHPVTVAVGGFRKVPSDESVRKMRSWLDEAMPLAHATYDLVRSLEMPAFRRRTDRLALFSKGEYAQLSGVVDSGAKRFPCHEYHAHISEKRVEYSTACFTRHEGRDYRVGALSRLRRSGQHLHPATRALFRKSGLAKQWDSPFCNNLAQALELVHVIAEARDTLAQASFGNEPLHKGARKGRGVSCIEAPRGLLFHDYTIGPNGLIRDAAILTPTSQNLLAMQEDIRAYVPELLDREKEEIALEVEKLIRSYDPCFSCGGHLPEVEWA